MTPSAEYRERFAELLRLAEEVDPKDVRMQFAILSILRAYVLMPKYLAQGWRRRV